MLRKFMRHGDTSSFRKYKRWFRKLRRKFQDLNAVFDDPLIFKKQLTLIIKK
jgi:hypothetical protein